jgi:Glycosyl hydrolases family 31/Domain of unknown function (DUF5110)
VCRYNPLVEPIVRKYLELRYRLLPYTYTIARECTETGLPLMRALWLHHHDDPQAIARGDQFLWGRDILVSPVVEKGATSRRLYLPRGVWFDFWTEERLEGGREIDRKVDLETMPLHVRASAILPFGPVKQYVEDPVAGPLSVVVYPGANGAFSLYEDDGRTFDYRKGVWMRTAMTWNDTARVLSASLAPGSRMLPPARRDIEVRVAGEPRGEWCSRGNRSTCGSGNDGQRRSVSSRTASSLTLRSGRDAATPRLRMLAILRRPLPAPFPLGS